MNKEILKMEIKNAARAAVKNAAGEIKPADMMRDCENFKSSRYCLVGLNQKLECKKSCRYYKKEA